MVRDLSRVAGYYARFSLAGAARLYDGRDGRFPQLDAEYLSAEMRRACRRESAESHEGAPARFNAYAQAAPSRPTPARFSIFAIRRGCSKSRHALPCPDVDDVYA